MSTLSTARTLADVISELGVTPDRILASPPIGTATEADLIRIVESGKRLAELVDGTIVEKAVGFEESVITAAICELLRQHVVPRCSRYRFGRSSAIWIDTADLPRRKIRT